MEPTTKDGRSPAVAKLLRVLVAGGVAMAGVTAPMVAGADDKTTPGKADKATAERARDAAAAEKAAPRKEEQKGEKKEEKEKAPPEDAGGVKGW